MTRPTPASLSQHSAAYADAEALRARMRARRRTDNRIFGYGVLLSLALGIAALFSWFGPVPVAVALTVAFVAFFVGSSVLVARRARTEQTLTRRLDRTAAAFTDVARAAVAADALTTYGVILDPADVPTEAGEEQRIAGGTVDGEQVTVLARFADADSPLQLERIVPVAA